MTPLSGIRPTSHLTTPRNSAVRRCPANFVI